MTDEQTTDPQDPPAGPPPGDPDGGTGASALDAVTRERDEYYDLLLRKTAEFDNYRRRVERERKDVVEFAVAEVLRDVLPTVDDLERALKMGAQSDDVSAYRQGVELVLKRLADALRKRGVTPIDAAGKDFDPHLHQAVTRETTTTHRDGEVLEEFERGYLLGDRLLRPAMVKVAVRE